LILTVWFLQQFMRNKNMTKEFENLMLNHLKKEGAPMSQEKQILNHLQSGKRLTQLQALKKFGCFRLSARIGGLKAKGYDISTTPIKKNGKRFAQYHLVK